MNYPVPASSIVLLPGHIVVGPVIVGVGLDATETVVLAEPVHPLSETVTEYVPAFDTVIDCVVALVDQI